MRLFHSESCVFSTLPGRRGFLEAGLYQAPGSQVRRGAEGVQKREVGTVSKHFLLCCSPGATSSQDKRMGVTVPDEDQQMTRHILSLVLRLLAKVSMPGEQNRGQSPPLTLPLVPHSVESPGTPPRKNPGPHFISPSLLTVSQACVLIRHFAESPLKRLRFG